MAMFVTIINDCLDNNAFGRQLTRAASLLGCPVISIGVKNELEAAGNLIDTLDAAEDKKGVILVNVAPRHGSAKKWPNGTPFAYFKLGKTLVITTIDGYTLSLVKKLNLVQAVSLVDIPTALSYVVKKKLITSELKSLISETQFRSYEFTPRLAKWLLSGIRIPTMPYPLINVPNAPSAIWWVDNFGNCKTTMLPEDIGFKAGNKVKTPFGSLLCYNRLKDVPNKRLGLIIGSSGYGDKRFLEITIQGGNAWKKLNLR
jgi:hypothetical protein